MTTRRFEIPWRPVPFARTGTTPTGKRFNPARYRDWKTRTAGLMNLTRHGHTFDGPVVLLLEVHADRVIAVFHDEPTVTRPTTLRGDLDNYTKAVLDAATDGHVIVDDRQVVAIVTTFAGGTP